MKHKKKERINNTDKKRKEKWKSNKRDQVFVRDRIDEFNVGKRYNWNWS